MVLQSPTRGCLPWMILVSSDATLEVNWRSILPFVILRGASLHSNPQSGMDAHTLQVARFDLLINGRKRGETRLG